MSGSVSVRPMSAADVAAVAQLYRMNSRAELSAQERAAQGFVQGQFTTDRLLDVAHQQRGFVAEIDGRVAGVTIIHFADDFAAAGAEKPPVAAVRVAREAELHKPLLYGPAVVSGEFRRRGVLRALVDAVLTAAATAGYEAVVAFIEQENTVSAAAHERLGWRRIGGFTFDGREYDVVSRAVA